MSAFRRGLGNWLYSHRFTILVVLVLVALAFSGYSSYKSRQTSLSANVTATQSKVIAKVSIRTSRSTAKLARENRKLIRDGQQAHDVLCIFKSKLKRDIRASQDFLREHPEGIPGIPVALIAKSLSDNKRDLRSLKGLKCDGNALS